MGLFLFFFFSFVQAHVVSLPSNITHALGSSGFRIDGQTPLTGREVHPLTPNLIKQNDEQLKNFIVSGTATQVIPGNSLDLKTSEIAFISCDQDDYNGGYIGVDDTIDYVTSANSAAAIVLYSKAATHCNFTSDASTAETYPNIFTFDSLNSYRLLRQALDHSTPRISIVSMSQMNGVATDTGGSGDSGDSPNTAMIILYSITGIITALFLGIIITGAIRAHRHPERYGPRRIAGRVRQSRARGIARAMLDTIPVVKFDDRNDRDDVEAAKHQVEMSLDPEHPPTPQDGITASTPESELPENERPAEAKTEMPDGGNFSCPICTDDFVKGQDLRVLPCNHQFHMECIDPWLINVSGTCPLCRIDLNPQNPEQPDDPEHTEPDPATEEATPEDTRQHARQQARHTHRRLSDYLHGPLNARRMRDATVEERIAALRRVREENHGEDGEGARRRLSTRLRDRFRIRTRSHGEPSDAAPAVPAPVHLTSGV